MCSMKQQIVYDHGLQQHHCTHGCKTQPALAGRLRRKIEGEGISPKGVARMPNPPDPRPRAGSADVPAMPGTAVTSGSTAPSTGEV